MNRTCDNCNRIYATSQGLKQHLLKKRCRKDTSSICTSIEDDISDKQYIRDTPLYKKIINVLYNGNESILMERTPPIKQFTFNSFDECTLLPFTEHRQKTFVNRFIECYTYSYHIMNTIDGISKCINDYYLLFDAEYDNCLLYKPVTSNDTTKCFYMNAEGVIIEDVSRDLLLQLITHYAVDTIILPQISCKIIHNIIFDIPYYVDEIDYDYKQLYMVRGLK